ncbi:MAG: PQQ-binding-like beta-propeller repeat protein [Verrucomicrobiota bacterium]
MKTTTLAAFVAAGCLGAGSLAWAGEWAQIAGPNHDRKTSEKLPEKWPAAGPKRVWEIPTGGGFGSVVTGDGRAYLVIGAKSKETAIAVDRKTGKELWRVPLGVMEYSKGGDRGAPKNDGGDGPRATPSYADGRVFVLGGGFDLWAFDAATGKVLWKHDLVKNFDGKEIHWSNAASPLVVGDRVYVAGGGKDQTYLAFRADTGAVIWKAGTDRQTYTTPILTKIHGKEQLLFMVERGVVARDPQNGKELWHYPFPYRTATAASPVVWEDIVNCSAGYGVGGGACKVTRKGDVWSVEEIWRSPGNRDTAAHWSTAVVVDGFMYGHYGHGEYGRAAFKCIDIRTGKVQWEQVGFGPGQTILAGGKLLVTSDAGRLVLVEPTKERYQELATAKPIDGKVWASIALSDAQVFLRSTSKAVCLAW